MERLQDEANPPDEITLGQFPVGSFYPMLIAIERGHFEDVGLNVQMTDNPILGGSRNISALLADNVDMVISVVPGPINLAREEGVYLKSVYAASVASREQPHGGYVTTREEFESWSEMEGGTVATLAGGPGMNIASFRWRLEQEGLDPFNDVEWRELPVPHLPSAVAQDEVVAAAALEPVLGGAIAQGPPIKRFEPTFGFEDPVAIGSAWITSEFAEEYEATVKLMQIGISSAIQDLEENPEPFAAIVNEHYDIPEESLLAMHERGDLGHFPKSAEEAQPIESIEFWEDMLLEYIQDISDERIETEQLVLPWNRP